MPKTRKGFKVVHKLYNGYESALPIGLLTMYSTDYWTKRTTAHGPFAVFKKLKHAEEFMGYRPYNTKLFKCLYTKSKDKSLYYYDNNYKFELKKRNLPPGTKCADTVKLTRIHL